MTAEMVEGSESRRVLRDGLLELLDRGQPGDGARNALGHRVKVRLRARLGKVRASEWQRAGCIMQQITSLIGKQGGPGNGMISPRACTGCGYYGHTKQWCKVKRARDADSELAIDEDKAHWLYPMWDASEKLTIKVLTGKQNPTVVVLANGRYASGQWRVGVPRVRRKRRTSRRPWSSRMNWSTNSKGWLTD